MEGVSEIATSYRIIKKYNLSPHNIDKVTISSFGEEWKSFHRFTVQDIKITGDKYFDIITPEMMQPDCKVIDIGCGSGRFIKYLEGRYGSIVGIDPSEAIFVADKLIGNNNKVELIQTSTDNIPFPDDYFDFGYSLGVLHHIPDTQMALNDSVKKIKSGGYFLLYLYYNFDNRSFVFKILFYLSNFIRFLVSKMPSKLKRFICDILAVILYMPFVGLVRFLKILRVPQKVRKKIPLQAYEDQSFYIIRNDSLDRFGTPLEQRFSRKQIESMMLKAGLSGIIFSDKDPFWHATGKKR